MSAHLDSRPLATNLRHLATNVVIGDSPRSVTVTSDNLRSRGECHSPEVSMIPRASWQSATGAPEALLMGPAPGAPPAARALRRSCALRHKGFSPNHLSLLFRVRLSAYVRAVLWSATTTSTWCWPSPRFGAGRRRGRPGDRTVHRNGETTHSRAGRTACRRNGNKQHRRQ
jgi:hypothetical protein